MSVSVLCLLLLAGCSSNGDPFSYVNASGKLTYEDGTLIPAKAIELRFYSQNEAIGNAHPRSGTASVDTKTGEFANITTHTPKDGLVRGKHKVTVTGRERVPLPIALVPAEYADPNKTPLEVDTDQVPFVIKVPKPGSGGQAAH